MLSNHPSLVQKLCLKKRLGWMKQSFIENIRPGVRLELITKYVRNALGLSSFCSFNFVLFWANLDLEEFWIKYESELRIISKVQMLLQQAFVLKKKYSKCQSKNFWTESRLAQDKAQNPTQLRSSHSLLFIGGAWGIKQHFLYPDSINDSNMNSFVILQTISPLCLWPRLIS